MILYYKKNIIEEKKHIKIFLIILYLYLHYIFKLYIFVNKIFFNYFNSIYRIK